MYMYERTHLNVSKIIVNNTNLPSKGTTSDVGGIISANSRKNTVSDSKIEMDKLTCNNNNIVASQKVFIDLLQF